MPAARPPRALVRLERWFQDELARPHERRARKPGVPAARHLSPSRTLAPAERLAIYSGGYFTRLLECMQSDFPAVQRVAGEARFRELVRAYLERHPSRHWSLNPLGRAFPGFLARRARRLPRGALLAELARLEWTLQEVFESEPDTALAPAALARVAPECWPGRRLVPVRSLRLLEFEHRANAIATAVRRGTELPPCARLRTFVAVYRKDWTVWRMDLERAPFAVLAALCRGRTLAQALAAGARSFRGPRAELEREVQRCFAEWTSEGFFRAVE